MTTPKLTPGTPEKPVLKTSRKRASRAKPKTATVQAKSVLKDKAAKDKAKPKKKDKKEKVIRDSFTMPKQEFEKIAELKKQCLQLGVNVKKSEILRAGLHALLKLTPQQLKIAVSKVEKIKTGRPS